MKELRASAIGNLARMICGDSPYNFFPYRSSSYLTSFFETLDFDYRHDGSTRYWWVRDVLLKLNKKTTINEELPSKEIVAVTEHLLHPDHFVGVSDVDQQKAVEAINKVLKSYELKVTINPKTSVPKLNSILGTFVSSSIEDRSSVEKITFSPSVFKTPKIKPDEKLVAVMMPFAAEFDNVYSTIKAACTSVGLFCYRADDMWKNSTFIQDIFELIYSSKVVIVDFTKRNPNVFYETGISHTLGKIVIPITQAIDDIPSDLQPHRALIYLSNNEGMEKLQKDLEKRLKTILEGHSWEHNKRMYNDSIQRT